MLQSRSKTQSRGSWVIGYAENFETFARALQSAWNGAHNEAVIAVLAPEIDDGEVFARVEQTNGLYPDGEEGLLTTYPTVVSRYYDGLWLDVRSTRLDQADAAGHFVRALAGHRGWRPA